MFKLTVRSIPEVAVEGKPLGRHVFHDSRSLDHKAELATALKSVLHRGNGSLPLDQGQIGSCTGNALAGALDLAPNTSPVSRRYTEPDAVLLYEWETAAEGKPYPPNDPGGSGLNVCKVAKQHGWITSYTHTFNIKDALLALVLRPVITGVNWYTSFDSPDSSGLISIAPGATVRGGHEFVVYEMIVPEGMNLNYPDLDDIVVWADNSWGTSYGRSGKFGMTAATWSQLLSEQGDVTVPIR